MTASGAPSDSDFEVFEREASTALTNQERRLDDLRKRALDVIGAASLLFGLFGAFRGPHGITWAIVGALFVFGFLVVVCVALQLPGKKRWYFVQDVTGLKEKRSATIAAGEPWNVHEYLADELERCYLCNQPRVDRRLSWLAGAFASLGLVVMFLAVDLIITNNQESNRGNAPAPTATTAAANGTP